MFVSRVFLENFRNLSSLDLSFDQGFVVLSGPNGAGKTNFLEALYYNLTLERFPESAFGQLFQEGKDFFRVAAAIGGGAEREAFAQTTEKSFKHQFKVNGKKVSRKKFSREAAAVSFLPQDLGLLTRSPRGRRRYLDETLSAAGVEYGRHLSKYKKTLRQRNELLTEIMEGRAQSSDLEVWTEKLVEHGSFLTRKRQQYLGFIKEETPGVMEQISPELSGIEFIYAPSGSSDRRSFKKLLSDKKDSELKRAATAAGPHRDDFQVLIEGKEAVGYLSRGQMRAATLLLKVLEAEYIEREKGFWPIMLLDDVFSEFDHAHQQKLLEFLKTQEQVFLTTAHLEEIEEQLPEDARIFRIEKGKIQSV